MENTSPDFYKKVFDDYFKFLKSPKEFLKEQLESFDPRWINKKWIAFVFVMHIYYLFLPAVIITTNIVSIVFAFFGVGVFYYLSQICLIKYQEQIGAEIYEQKKLYVFAYAFALAELTGFVLNILIMFFNLSQMFSVFSLILAVFATIPVFITVVLLKLSVFKVVEPEDFSLLTFLKLYIQSLVETVRNKLGYNAWVELWADFNNKGI